MKMVVFLPLFFIGIIYIPSVYSYASRKDYESRYYVEDEDYGLSYVEGENQYFYDPKYVSPMIKYYKPKNSMQAGYGLNLDGYFIKNSKRGHLEIQLLSESCVTNPKYAWISCICFNSGLDSIVRNNPKCDGQPALSVCVIDGRLYFNSHKTEVTNGIFFVDWNTGKFGVTNGFTLPEQVQRLSVAVENSFSWLNRKSTKTSAVNGIRVFPSYKKMPNKITVEHLKQFPCSSYYFFDALFVGHLIGTNLKTTDNINGTSIPFDAAPTDKIQVPSCDRLTKSCKRQCAVTQALAGGSCPSMNQATLLCTGIATVGYNYFS